MTTAWPRSILIVGCGNMGGAMLDGWLEGGLAPSRFTIVDPVREAGPDGVTVLREVPEARFDAILLGVKPQLLNTIVASIVPLADADTAILSILAGVELVSLQAGLPQAGGWCRIMPNLAAAIGKSPVAIAQVGLDDERREGVTALMRPLGPPEWIAEEQFDVVTALAGSGPAFVYRFVEALASGAVALGLESQQAERLALATVEGAGALAASSTLRPGELARRVASPGGTTQAGLERLDRDAAIARLIEATLRAASERSAELAMEARKQRKSAGF